MNDNTERVRFAAGETVFDRVITKTKGGGPWIYRLTEDWKFEPAKYGITPVTGCEFSSTWLEVKTDGTFVIKKDYAWDGNTKKISVLDVALIGTPDGIVDIRTLKPKMYYASLVHDALYQYLGYHGYGRAEADRIFYDIGRDAKFFCAPLYYAVVRILGWLFFVGVRFTRIDAGERPRTLRRAFVTGHR